MPAIGAKILRENNMYVAKIAWIVITLAIVVWVLAFESDYKSVVLFCYMVVSFFVLSVFKKQMKVGVNGSGAKKSKKEMRQNSDNRR